MTTTASPFLGRWCVTLQQSDVAVRLPARILAQRLLEPGRLRDELRRFALAREGARHEVRIAQSTTPAPSHLGYVLLNWPRILSGAMVDHGMTSARDAPGTGAATQGDGAHAGVQRPVR
ncbi:hypothetical protein [Streptomyces mirabilis]|uniref:hypothetical protein n=1 Tax=Streptomyces mirabilis TaxID=68239 RepID=UPI00331C063F